MYAIIIYESDRMLCAIVMRRGNDMASAGTKELKQYIDQHPLRSVVGLSPQPDGSYDVYALKCLRKLDVRLLKPTILGVLGGAARRILYEDLIIICNCLEGSSAGSKAIIELFNKNLQDAQNRKYTGFRFMAQMDNFKLMEVISFVGDM